MNSKIIFFIILLFTFKITKSLEITNQQGEPLIVITKYSNENYFRAYKKLSPILLELLKRKPTLELEFKNLKSIKIYSYAQMNTILKKTKKKESMDKKNNPFVKLQISLPKPLLEITGNELKNHKYLIMPDAAKKPTYMEINTKPIQKTDLLALLW